MSDAALVQLTRAQQALAECKTAMDAKNIADQAEALRVWAERAHASIDTVNRAVEVKIHAERRMGELLAQQPKNEGGRPAKTGNQDEPVSAPTLSDLGISKKESSRAQKLAALPAEEVTERIALAKADGGRLSTAKVLAPTPYVIQPQRSQLEKQAAQQQRASWADEYAGMAIDQLRKISKSDPKRGEALARVDAWIKENQ